MNMLAYCDNHSNLSHLWLKDGLSPCFFATISSSLLAAVAILGGGVQIYVYRKYAIQIQSSVAGRRKSSLERLYKLQLVLLALACIEPIVRLVLRLTVIRHGDIYWYDTVVNDA